MKLKAPPGVGDPCVAGVSITSRDGVYEVEAAVGALLIECFGFLDVGAEKKLKIPPAPPAPRQPAPAPWPKLTHPAWRARPAVKTP